MLLPCINRENKRSNFAFVLLVLTIVHFLVHASNALPLTINYTRFDCPNSSFIANGSSYQTNLKFLLSTLSSNVSNTKNGYYNFTSGRGSPNPVYGLALCRGDIASNDCQDCAQMATKELASACPTAKQATIWKELCMLRYSNESIFSLLDNSPQVVLQNKYEALNLVLWGQVLEDMMDNITSKAASGGSGKKFATREVRFSSVQTLYTLAQCTPDLTIGDCDKCFGVVTGRLPIQMQGGIVLTPSCSVRYEVYPFYLNYSLDPPAVSTLLASPPDHIGTRPTEKKKTSAAKIAVAIIVPLAILAVLLTIGVCLFQRKRKNYSSTNAQDAYNDFTTVESLLFDWGTLQAATNNFSDDHKLGEGGFGGVYKGTLSHGQDIAVKRLSKSSSQGVEEFKNEVVLVAKLQHRNLVRLLGFCLAGEEKLLVYEHVPNKSLNYFLFDPERRTQLNWPQRHNIIRGIARGMLYLHEDSRLKIIHRDLKASNILLDVDMNAKISDFGMARIFGLEQTQDDTSRVVGTYGYMAPEYAMQGQYSVKSDVYSFGVLVLEIVSGQKISVFHQSDIGEHLVSYAWRCWKDGTPLEFMDPTLRDTHISDEVISCIHIGLSCVQENMNERPTMARIVTMLNSYSTTSSLSMPHRPAFFYGSNTESAYVVRSEGYSTSTTSTEITKPWSINEATVSEMDPR